MKLPKRNLTIIALIFIATVLFFTSAFGKATYKSFLFTSEIISGFPVKTLNIFGFETIKEKVDIPTKDGSIKANIYRPAQKGQFPAVIFSIGLTPKGIDDDYLNVVGDTLAKIGIVTVVAEIFDTNFTEENDVQDLTSTFKVTQSLNYVDREKIGFVGFCLGGSFSVIAASDDEISNDVSFMVLISPYFDNYKMIEAVVTRKTELDGQVVNWTPDELNTQVILDGYTKYISTFISDEDASVIRESVKNNYLLSNDDQNRLADGSRAMYKTLVAKTEQDFRKSIDSYPDSEKKALENTSPKNFTHKIKPSTSIYTLSDVQDTYVPRSETLAFREAFPDGTFVEIDSFQHVRPGTSLPRLAAITQSARVFSFVHGIMREVFTD